MPRREPRRISTGTICKFLLAVAVACCFTTQSYNFHPTLPNFHRAFCICRMHVATKNQSYIRKTLYIKHLQIQCMITFSILHAYNLLIFSALHYIFSRLCRIASRVYTCPCVCVRAFIIIYACAYAYFYKIIIHPT